MFDLLKRYSIDENDGDWSPELAQEAFRRMTLIRIFEEKSVEMYKMGLMGGSLHPSIGQEAVATGIGMHLRDGDSITMTYRGRGQALAKGADPYKLYAELMGRIDGYCKGKGGSMHITSLKHGILGANGIVGAGIPIAVGAALTAKNKKNGRVAVTFFGDGATNQGVFHESMNMAAVLALPVIFVCENNLYSEMTPIKESLLNEDIAERGLAYRIPSIIVDGNDVRAVYAAAEEAVERARLNEGPTFIEAKTYRLLGHMFGDSETYRTKEEVNQWWAKEPIVRFRQHCVRKGILSEVQMDEIHKQVIQQIEEAYDRAKLSAEPEMEEIFNDVY